MFVTLKLAILCVCAFLFGFTVVMTNVLTVYKFGQILLGNWALMNFGMLAALVPFTFAMDTVLWYLITELSSVYEFGARPRRTHL